MHVSHVNKDFNLDSIVPFFQPIVDLSNNAVWRYECLARMLNMQQQPFVPSEMLFLIDRRQSVAGLTQTIFNHCANYFRNINVAWNINVSLEDMLDPEIALFMRVQLQHYPNPQRISIEITANNALDNLSAFNDFAAFCQSLNIGITLDHFDLCQCNLSQLLSLPVDAIKVSANFLQNIEENQGIKQALEYLAEQADARQIKLIAEHIEQAEVLAIVRQLGFRYVQGFYLSEPKANLS